MYNKNSILWVNIYVYLSDHNYHLNAYIFLHKRDQKNLYQVFMVIPISELK